jgi:hypothetical protein
MKKIVALFCIVFTFSQLVFSAEDNRKIVAVYPFSGNEDVAKILQERISNELLKLNRVIVVNRKGHSTETSQPTEAFTTSHTIGDFGRQMGATHVLTGKVTNATFSEKKELWTARVALELSVIDVSSGRILLTYAFTTTQTRKKSKEQALEDIFKNLASRSLPFLRNSFPIEGRISAVGEKTNSKGVVEIESLLINLGTIEGIKKGMKFDVFEEIYVPDGNQSKILEDFVGQIRVKEVKGENFSLTTISKNKEKMQKIRENPNAFIVKTPQEKMK